MGLYFYKRGGSISIVIQLNVTLHLEHFPLGWSPTELNSHWDEWREDWLRGIGVKKISQEAMLKGLWLGQFIRINIIGKYHGLL